MKPSDVQGRNALVTGASSALGVAFAEQLAAAGAGLILVARREDRLYPLADRLRTQYGADVMVIAADLADPETPKMLFETVNARMPVDILINNASVGLHGPDRDIEWADSRRMLQLDILAMSELTKRFASGMRERGWGRVLQVAGLAAYLPLPHRAAHAAAKAFVRHYGEALHAEWRGSGLSCTVLSPGIIDSAVDDGDGRPQHALQRFIAMPSVQVARIGLRAMVRGRRSVVPGILNTLLSLLLGFTPRSLQIRAAARFRRH